MAGGGAGASSPFSSSLPRPSTEEASEPSATVPVPTPAARAPVGGGLRGDPRPPPSAPQLSGGEFLLQLLQSRPQCRANPPPPPGVAAASGSGGRGEGHGDPAVAAVGPSVPFLHPLPVGGFPGDVAAAAVAPVNPHPHGPPPWAGAGAGYPGFHQGPWAPPPLEFGSSGRPPPPPPPGFHHHQHYSHHYNKYNASQAVGALPAFSPPLGFLAGPFDDRDLRRNPGHSQYPQHQHQQERPRRGGLPMEGMPLLFGSPPRAGSGGSLSQCDPFLRDKIDASSRGVQVRPGVLNPHSVALNASTGYDHERERVLDSGPSFVFGSFSGSNWIRQQNAHQQLSHQWRESGDRLGQKHQGSPLPESGKTEPGKLPCPQKKAKDVRKRVPSSNGRNGVHTVEELADLQSGEHQHSSCYRESVLSPYLESATQLVSPPLQREAHSLVASDVKEHTEDLHFNSASVVQKEEQICDEGAGLVCINNSNAGQDLRSEHVVDSLEITDEIAEKRVEVHVNTSRGKDYRSDFSRGHHVLSQRMRNRRRALRCRLNIAGFTPFLLGIYESLVQSQEEKAKQMQLLQSLEKLVINEWPNARLYLYGSCANTFGVSNSDVDVCLVIDDNGIKKSEILLKLADILQSDNLQNVQALTRARVPIVKLMDPVTGISCDICINNMLAVINTKLLRDYAQIDDRLRQLAFIVKHWAKSRGVNDTYQGTLSSYAYVLMCIHFLQLRKPAILPCLQEMEATYVVTVDDIYCAFFDQVEKLRDFGAGNRENIAELLWAFFSYWAYYHDYANDVISVRTGGIMSKQSKDWTRRIGNDRHLICIEDPFELSHDLGRVVDKYTIKVLREEFERAAEIMQYDPNPSVKLFEPYVRVSEQD